MQEPKIHQLLRSLVSEEGSDLHLPPTLPSRVRVHGEMQPLKMEPLPGEQINQLLTEIMNEDQRERWNRSTDLDFAYDAGPEIGRFRVNAYHSRRGVGAVLRTIPHKIPSAGDLRLPDAITRLARLPNGLVLVTGPTGSGKSTTLAALIDLINQTRAGHIVTIEDPVEFTHESKLSIITHRELGPDTPTFASALKHALRQDPDVIVVGEIRDAETIQLALSAAETGHLVFGTLHTNSAMKTMTRVVDMVPSERQSQVRAQFADVLRAVVTQRLIRKRGGGRMGVYEILINTVPVANNIRQDKPALIEAAMNEKATGMQTLERALALHVIQGWVDPEEAKQEANDPAKLQEEVDTMRNSTPAAPTGNPAPARPGWAATTQPR